MLAELRFNLRGGRKGEASFSLLPSLNQCSLSSYHKINCGSLAIRTYTLYREWAEESMSSSYDLKTPIVGNARGSSGLNLISERGSNVSRTFEIDFALN